jgi:HPt (histidine-containing phosphotransfer) domain-containing protein
MTDPPIDVDHLNRYTGGEPGLNEEILQLFDSQCVAIVDRLEELANKSGAGGKTWHELLHTLKGAARGVGAFALAEIAAEGEKLNGDKIVALELVDRLKVRSGAVHAFVAELVKSAA